MFSGLTNQVSNWMGKKGEDGSELPAEENVATEAGVEVSAEKDARYLIYT